MIKNEKFIKELINKSSTLNLQQIQEWLSKHEDDYKHAINISSCRKWHKMTNHKEIPYPCVCQKREKTCVFIELYYELDKIIKQINCSEFHKSGIIEIFVVTQNKPYKKIKFLIQE